MCVYCSLSSKVNNEVTAQRMKDFDLLVLISAALNSSLSSCIVLCCDLYSLCA